MSTNATLLDDRRAPRMPPDAGEPRRHGERPPSAAARAQLCAGPPGLAHRRVVRPRGRRGRHALSPPRLPAGGPPPRPGAAGMSRVAVIGAGTMGNGIAHVFAPQGWEVALIDVSSEALERGL